MAREPTLPLVLPKALISLPADKLLDQFGSGGHSPGSGSAAALMGLLASQLILTVCKISVNQEDEARFSFVLNQINDRIVPDLKTLFQRDAEDFDEVIRTRVERDRETDPAEKRRLREKSLRLLRSATDLVFLISRRCINLIDYGLIVFDLGANKVRGDSGAAISAAIAGAMSGVFIINLNLRSFQEGDWAVRRRLDCDQLYADILRKQEDAFIRITTLRPEDVDDIQPTLF